MIKLLLLLTAFLLIPARAQSQQPPAPIERRAPAAPQPSVYDWPRPGGVKPHTKLLISTFDAIHPHLCTLVDLDENHVVCDAGRRSPDAAYDRAFVQKIQVAPRGYQALSAAKIAALEGGGFSLGLSFLCGVDGGPVCKTPGVVGLSLLAGGVVLHIAQVHARNKEPKLIYISTARPTLQRWPPVFP